MKDHVIVHPTLEFLFLYYAVFVYPEKEECIETMVLIYQDA